MISRTRRNPRPAPLSQRSQLTIAVVVLVCALVVVAAIIARSTLEEAALEANEAPPGSLLHMDPEQVALEARQAWLDAPVLEARSVPQAGDELVFQIDRQTGYSISKGVRAQFPHDPPLQAWMRGENGYLLTGHARASGGSGYCYQRFDPTAADVTPWHEKPPIPIAQESARGAGAVQYSLDDAGGGMVRLASTVTAPDGTREAGYALIEERGRAVVEAQVPGQPAIWTYAYPARIAQLPEPVLVCTPDGLPPAPGTIPQR